MPRVAREKSESQIYHVMLRGINRQNIFQDEEDNSEFLQRLFRYKSECGFCINAYALMQNHVHLLIKVEKDSLSTVMKKLSGSYAYYFNWKYNRVGHLFQDRYKSEPVDNDAYFLTVNRYIHQNPTKVGNPIGLNTSYEEYANGATNVDVELAMSLFQDDRKKLIAYLLEQNDDKCLEIEMNARISDVKAKEMILSIAKIKHCQALQEIATDRQKIILAKLRKQGLSIRQIERLTGINRGVILRCKD